MIQPESIECPHCGTIIESPKCQSTSHEPCWYSCFTCGSNIPLETDPTVTLLKLPYQRPNNWSPHLYATAIGIHDSPISTDIEELIGRIIVVVAWAENRLWDILPGDKRGNYPSFLNDLKSLEKLKYSSHEWPDVDSLITKDYMCQRLEKQIDVIKKCYEAVRKDRNALAHGSLLIDTEIHFSYTPCGEAETLFSVPTERPLYMASKRNPEHQIELTEDVLKQILLRGEELFRSVNGLLPIAILTWKATRDGDH